MYISYLGVRTNRLADVFGVTRQTFVFRGFSQLIPLWKDSISDDKSLASLRCEGLLLYSFSVLGEQIAAEPQEICDTFLLIKQYIDEHFSEPTLSLKTLGKRFCYNEKYISATFKKRFRIGVTQYITALRIQKACALMEQGFTSVGDISSQCGFADPLYFSKVFKIQMGISPKTHISQLRKQKESEEWQTKVSDTWFLRIDFSYTLFAVRLQNNTV